MVDDDGEVEEKLEVDKTFNPTIQYFQQVVTHRVVNPEQAGETPPMNPIIQEYMQQEEVFQQRAAQEILDFDNAFNIE